MTGGTVPGSRLTSADVARRAGVSRSTVSYVLNETPGQRISQATRERVLEAARELGYTPSAAARALRSGRSEVVLCLLPELPDGYTVGGFLQTMSAAFAERGLTLVAHPVPADDVRLGRVWRAVAPAAVVGLTQLTPGEIADLEPLGVPVAEVVCGDVDHDLPRVVLPDCTIGVTQATHLTAQGHRRIGYGYPRDPRLAAFADVRLAAVREACAAAGAEPPHVVMTGADPEDAAEALREWGEAGVTAVCAYDDHHAMAVVAGASTRGLRVPDDVAVIGVGDLPAARCSVPGLTTVAVDMRPYAERLARIVLDALALTKAPGAGQDDVQEPDEGGHVFVGDAVDETDGVALVVRATT
ncbi:LacI family transcriptional regulator [Xylanimonas oleitrophica]|uniref:LacI family transcriptional regulator n=1 Tax=Xylanimonas oleitrophica TaxID=2607479 RepID=A0A2W5Y2T4_9MICO|nr:LacI family DNA-binding transcriptional regulator [Xylanimonas oleitrophica]PZR51974.1 LacI family transcriptional regulator [Xylanimonas oleitrophica]